MGERTGFLYPFLEDPSVEHPPDDPEALLADLARSAASKWEESGALRRAVCSANEDEVRGAAGAVARRLASGARVFAFGNGGSSADADAFVAGCRAIRPHPVPALSLCADPAVLTALANDVGSDVIFTRQLGAHARPGDVAVAFSTSGGSPNLLEAFAHCRRHGVLTIGLTGHDGPRLGPSVDHRFVVQATSIHRIQEAQTALATRLTAAISTAMAEGAA